MLNFLNTCSDKNIERKTIVEFKCISAQFESGSGETSGIGRQCVTKPKIWTNPNLKLFWYQNFLKPNLNVKSIPILFSISKHFANRYWYFFQYQFFETDTNTSFDNNCFSKPIPIPSNKLGKFWNRNVTLCQKRSRGQDCLNHRPNMSRDILSTLSKETRQHTTTTVQIRKSTLISRWPTNKDLTLALLFSKLMTGLKICQISNCLETKMKVSNTLTRHESFMDLD